MTNGIVVNLTKPKQIISVCMTFTRNRGNHHSTIQSLSDCSLFWSAII